MSEEPDTGFPTARLEWAGPDGKGHLHLRCACGEEVERDIDLRELTVILCPRCREPIFRGGPEK